MPERDATRPIMARDYGSSTKATVSVGPLETQGRYLPNKRKEPTPQPGRYRRWPPPPWKCCSIGGWRPAKGGPCSPYPASMAAGIA